MACRTLRVRFITGNELEYSIHQGGMWTWMELPHGGLVLVVRSGPGIRGGVSYPGRYEIPAANIAHVELVRGGDHQC